MTKLEKRNLRDAARGLRKLEEERAQGVQIEKTRAYNQTCEKCGDRCEVARYDGKWWWASFRPCLTCGFERQEGGPRRSIRPVTRPCSADRAFLYGERALEMKETVKALRAEGNTRRATVEVN